MSRLLVHLAVGPEHPTRAALALLVARTARRQDHEVDLFLAGDAVSLLRDVTMDAVHGVGIGSLREHFDALVASGGRVYASKMSSNALAWTPPPSAPRRLSSSPPTAWWS